MSIKFNGKTVAGNYKIQLSTEATTAQKGLIRIATDEEAQLGKLEDVAITPKQLSEYGGGGSGSGGSTNTLVDDVTIVKDDDTDIITAVGIKTKNGEYLFDWVGTEEEYNTAIADGTIPENENWVCWITDDGTDADDIIKNKADVNLSNLSEEGKAIVDSKASVDLDNLTTTGEKHFLNKSQITNCLLEIPQRIKYDLTDGTLTIKAGSVVIIPNGFESDGVAPKFDYVTIESDLTIALGWTINGKTFLFYDVSENALYNQPPNWSNSNLWSGASPTIDKQYGIWYNTSNNIIQGTQDTGATWVGKYSLPLAIYSCGASKEILSIDQVFNGFGYIGSTVWVDKGVKGLIPNGRNEDGSLNNIEWVNDKIRTTGADDTGNFYVAYQLDIDNFGIKAPASWVFDENENIFVYKNGTEHTLLILGNVNLDAGVITSFNPKQPFRITDNAVSKSGDTMTGDLIVENETPVISLKTSNIESSVPPDVSAGVAHFTITDKNGQAMGQVALERYTDGRNTMKIQAFSLDGTSAPAIRVHASADNTAKFTLSENPPANSNGNDIATTAFCDGQWVAKTLVLEESASHSGTAAFSFSLADYLPNDGKLYEVKFFIAGAASGTVQWNYTMGFIREQALFIKSNNFNSNLIGLADSTRKLTIYPTSISTGSTQGSITLRAYRRVR